MPRSTTLLLVLVGLTAAGCTRQENDRLELGADMVLPVFQAPAETTRDSTPSISSLDRSHWEPVVFVIPVNGVAHQPPYAPPTFSLDTLPRQRGEQPTALTSLDLGEPDAWAEVGQTFQSHGLAVLDAALLVPRLFVRSPCDTMWSPRISYERAPARVITAPTTVCEMCGTAPGACACEPADVDATPAPPADAAPLDTVPEAATPADTLEMP